METLRTPDARFTGLRDWNFEPLHAEVPSGDGDTLRVHYVDAGPRQAAPMLLMHGGPTWGYLFRKMIPILAEMGQRVVVPDLIGAGRSGEPASRTDLRKSPQRNVAGAQGREHPSLPDAGHFAPEDRPEELARILLAFIGETP